MFDGSCRLSLHFNSPSRRGQHRACHRVSIESEITVLMPEIRIESRHRLALFVRVGQYEAFCA